MKTFLLILTVLLLIPAATLFAQGTSKDAADSTKRIQEADEFVRTEVEPKFDMEELQSHLIYPEDARKEGIEGLVVVQVYIDKEGHIVKTQIAQSDNALLAEAAVNAVKQTTFTSAYQYGKPIELWISIPINFRLN